MNQDFQSQLNDNRLEFCKYRCRKIKDDISFLNPNSIYERCYYCPIKDFIEYIKDEGDRLLCKKIK